MKKLILGAVFFSIALPAFAEIQRMKIVNTTIGNLLTCNTAMKDNGLITFQGKNNKTCYYAHSFNKDTNFAAADLAILLSAETNGGEVIFYEDGNYNVTNLHFVSPAK